MRILYLIKATIRKQKLLISDKSIHFHKSNLQVNSALVVIVYNLQRDCEEQAKKGIALNAHPLPFFRFRYDSFTENR